MCAKLLTYLRALICVQPNFRSKGELLMRKFAHRRNKFLSNNLSILNRLNTRALVSIGQAKQ